MVWLVEPTKNSYPTKRNSFHLCTEGNLKLDRKSWLLLDSLVCVEA